MRRLAALLLMTLPLSAVIVDRVAVSAGNKVITDSEISLRIRLTAFQNGEKPEFGAAARRSATERLIDQKLVEREMELGRYSSVSAEQGVELLREYAEKNFKGSMADLLRALAGYRLTQEELENDLSWQADLLNFLTLRFRPSVQVTDEDIQQYYRKNIQPKAAPGDEISLDEFRVRIEEAITDERADRELDLWLKDQRKRNRIEYLEKELAP